MNDLISVIVPVYNVEEYLPKCLDSIVNQTYKNLEIILVDDGSTDKSGQICDEYAKKDNRIKVIHKQNGGLSDARNVGLDICKGQYIGFVDSDDYISLDMYEKLYKFAVENNLDVSMGCALNVVDEKVTSNKKFSAFIVSGIENIISEVYIYRRGASGIGVWNKIYRRHVVSNIRFEVGKFYEDVFFSLQWIKNTKLFGHIPDGVYFYVQRDGSITHVSKYTDKILDVVEGYEKNLVLIKSYYPGAVSAAYFRLFWAYRTALESVYVCEDKDEHLDVVRDLQQKIRAGWKFWLFSKDVGFKAKVAYVLISLNVDLYMWVKKMMK